MWRSSRISCGWVAWATAKAVSPSIVVMGSWRASRTMRSARSMLEASSSTMRMRAISRRLPFPFPRSSSCCGRVAPGSGGELRAQSRVHPVGAVAACARRADEVEGVGDRGGRLTCVDAQWMVIYEPAHGDLPAVALDRLALDRAPLLGDVEERLQQHATLCTATRDAAGLIGARERIEHCFDDRYALGVFGDRVDATQPTHEVEVCPGHQRPVEVRREELLRLRPHAALELRLDVVLLDGRVDPLLEDARRFLLG